MFGTGVGCKSSGFVPGILLAISIRGSTLAATVDVCAGAGAGGCACAANGSVTLTRLNSNTETLTVIKSSLAEQFRRDSASATRDKSAARVMRLVQLFEALAGNVRVDLRSREVAVPKEHLDDTQVCTVVEQMRGERMPQRVRREFLRDAGFARVALDDVPEGLARHPIATSRREQVVGLALEQDLTARAPCKIFQPAHRFLTQRDEAFAVAFTEDADHALGSVDLAVTEIDELGYPQARRVEHLEHRTVTIAERIAHDRRAEQGFDFLLRQRIR